MAGDWLEDLVHQLYASRGYVCLRNIPGEAKAGGGRDEIDLLALLYNENKIKEVLWIEITGYLRSGAKTVEGKFSPRKENYIRNYLKEMYSIDVGPRKIQKKFYVAHYHPRIRENKGLPATLVMNKEIIGECEKAIQEYKSKYHRISGSKSNKELLTLPEAFGQLKFAKWIIRMKESQ